MGLELATTPRRDSFRNCGRIPCDRLSRNLPNPLLRLRKVRTWIQHSRLPPQEFTSCRIVEFLQQGGPKPHVVLRLNIDPIVQVSHKIYMGCRLAMDLEGGLAGIFHISPLPYNDASHAAHAAFEFKLKVSHWTVDNVLAAIIYPNDLLDFSFAGGFRVQGDGTEYTDGCRDFISQVFIILHKSGFVGWHVYNIDKGLFNATNLAVRQGRTGFHEITGYNYRNPTNVSRPTIVESLPLARGTFHDQGFRRILDYQIDDRHQYQLPYDPGDPQEGDEGHDTNIKAGWKASGLWPVCMSKPLMSRLLLKNSNQQDRPASTTLGDEHIPDWNRNSSSINWVTPQKSLDIRNQAREFLALGDTDSATCRVLFRKVAKSLDDKDFIIASHELRIQQLEARVQQLEPRKRRKVQTSPNSRFAGIRAIREAQIEAGDRQVGSDEPELSEDSESVGNFIEVEE